ncbi:hypothetical protein EVAR_17052_1 [Eumeta japonica]|uniref:Uncharacterized protein n=1 Tax=Eumeta variegata TaxID=151549 RepID=A0A4C1V698_EUMVA|nr:hypothetical protein EVAR_17052_1 [Eumeta japonica]
MASEKIGEPKRRKSSRFTFLRPGLIDQNRAKYELAPSLAEPGSRAGPGLEFRVRNKSRPRLKLRVRQIGIEIGSKTEIENGIAIEIKMKESILYPHARSRGRKLSQNNLEMIR